MKLIPEIIAGIVLWIFLLTGIYMGLGTIDVMTSVVMGMYVILSLVIVLMIKFKPPMLSYFMVGFITGLIPALVNWILQIIEFDIITSIFGSFGNGLLTLLVGVVFMKYGGK